jgi:CrcB protein
MFLKNILTVALGGALGSVLRYLGQKYFFALSHSFPFATFLINIIGCFLIGVFYSLWVKQQPVNEEMRLLLMTGFCGGFTTFSAFTLEGMQLIQQEKILIFFLYFAASVITGLLATFAGVWIAR